MRRRLLLVHKIRRHCRSSRHCLPPVCALVGRWADATPPPQLQPSRDSSDPPETRSISKHSAESRLRRLSHCHCGAIRVSALACRTRSLATLAQSTLNRAVHGRFGRKGARASIACTTYRQIISLGPPTGGGLVRALWEFRARALRGAFCRLPTTQTQTQTQTSSRTTTQLKAGR